MSEQVISESCIGRVALYHTTNVYEPAVMDRNYNLFLARVCEQAERNEDMVHHVRALVTMGTDLTLEERNLFSVAYKNVVGSRRTAWRAIQGI